MRTTGTTKPGTRFSRAVAVGGILLLASPFMFLGAISWFNYTGWMKGRDRYPIVAWFSAWFGLSAVFSIAVIYLIAGGNAVDRFGGVGTIIMLVGGVAGATAMWWYDQSAAERPTLKVAPSSRLSRPVLVVLLRIFGLTLAAVGVCLAVGSFVVDVFPADATLRTSLWLVLAGGGLYLTATYGFASAGRQDRQT
jgi:hypothetical protein